MDIEHITWKIVGVRPLMQSNYKESMSVDTATKPTRGSTKSREKPFDEAAKQLYNGEVGFWHPALSFWRSILDNCVGFKATGVAASSWLPKILFPLDEEEFILYDPDTLDSKKPRKLTVKDWTMDSRRVVNEKRGGLIVHRPKWLKWGGLLTMEVDMEAFRAKHEEMEILVTITDILNLAGKFGIGAGRVRLDQKTKRWGGLGLGKFVATLVEARK